MELNRSRVEVAALWAQLGLAYQQQRRLKLAQASYARALEIDPKNTAVRNSYGYVLTESGDAAGGLREFRKILQQDPNDVHVQVNLGYAYIGLGD